MPQQHEKAKEHSRIKDTAERRAGNAADATAIADHQRVIMSLVQVLTSRENSLPARFHVRSLIAMLLPAGFMLQRI